MSTIYVFNSQADFLQVKLDAKFDNLYRDRDNYTMFLQFRHNTENTILDFVTRVLSANFNEINWRDFFLCLFAESCDDYNILVKKPNDLFDYLVKYNLKLRVCISDLDKLFPDWQINQSQRLAIYALLHLPNYLEAYHHPVELYLFISEEIMCKMATMQINTKNICYIG